MKRGCGCLIFAVLLANAGLAVLVGEKLKAASELAVVHFHERFNDGKLDAIWDDAHPDFRAAFSTKGNYSNYMESAQKKFGKVKSSRQVKFTWFGKKEIILRTTFERGSAIETFTFEWKPFDVSLGGYSLTAE